MASRKRGLGRGLGAIIPQDGGKEEPGLQLKEIDIKLIDPNPSQPRKVMDGEKLNELVESIKEHGVVQPVVVRPVKGDRYQLIAGERRWRACRELGLKYIPAIVKEYDDLEATAVALIENIQRENLNALEEAHAYSRLLNEFGLTQEDVSRRLGKSRPFIANMVRLLSLPDEIKKLVGNGSLSAGHARALVALKDRDLQLAAALKIIRRGLNVRQAEQMVKKMLQEREKTGVDQPPDPEIKTTEKLVAKKLGAKVAIKKGKSGRGKITISFSSEEELKKLIGFLTGQNVSRET